MTAWLTSTAAAGVLAAEKMRNMSLQYLLRAEGKRRLTVGWWCGPAGRAARVADRAGLAGACAGIPHARMECA
eukprot:4528442-Prymnesium_polylepis.1